MKKAKRFIIKGNVQGVGFRYFTHFIANRIGIYGYVRNLADGSVEVYSIGSEEQLKILKEKLSIGPSFSKVDSVFEEDVQINSNFKSFNIR